MNYKKVAFTIIEILIVLLLVTILIAVGLFIPLRAGKLNAAASKLMFDLRYAQQLAISRQLPCGIYFNLSSNSYYVYQNNNTSDIPRDPYTAEDYMVDYNNLSQLKGVSIISTNFGGRIYFNYMGVPYDNSGFSLNSTGIVVLGQAAQTKSITIEPRTGQVKTP